MTIANLVSAAAAESREGRILLVEDEATNLAILTAYLRAAGYDVATAIDGQIARALLDTDNRFDLIVTDRRMPNLDGLQLALHVRNNARTRHIPVVMQTGADTQEEIQEGIKAGVFYYLVKPYEEATLLGIVSSALQTQRRQAMFEARASRQNTALNTMVSGDFTLRTPEDVQNLALLIGALFARPDLATAGLYELMLNGIEHGNLGIGYEAKNLLVAEKKWEAAVQRRLDLPENAGKTVSVEFRRTKQANEIVIADMGQGFDWQAFLQIEPSRATRGNGRGIAKAVQLCFDKVEYIGSGSVVKIISK